MRHIVLGSVLCLVVGYGAAAAAQPVFQPLDSSMVPQSAPSTTSAAAPQTLDSPPVESGSASPVSHSGEVIDSVGGGAIPALPLEVMTENGISYLSGGVSDEETEQLKQQEDNYNLRLLVTGQGGEFVSDLSLVVKDAAGTALLTINDAGPCVYAQLPAGKYVIDVTTEAGTHKNVPMSVPAKGAIRSQIRI